MPKIENLDKSSFLGLNMKGKVENIVLCVVAGFFSSLMVIINHLNLPGEIHSVKTEWDQAIPFILTFVLAYLLYYPFVYGGWAFIFVFWPKIFRPYAIAMMTIGLITGIVDITYNTYAARAIFVPTDILGHILSWLYNQNTPTTALPSLHVAHSICTGFFLNKILPKISGVWVTCVILITLSTLFVKTHYLVDVIISVFLGLIISLSTWWIWQRWNYTHEPARDYKDYFSSSLKSSVNNKLTALVTKTPRNAVQNESTVKPK